MKIKVSEALRLKNDISQLVSRYQSRMLNLPKNCFGITRIDGEIQILPEDVDFFEKFNTLDVLLNISGEINNKLAVFDVESEISSMVRRLKNLELMKNILESNIENAKAYSKDEKDYGSTKSKKISFEPHEGINKKEIKSKIKTINKEMRFIQSIIDEKNAQDIELSFNYDDIDTIKELI